MQHAAVLSDSRDGLLGCHKRGGCPVEDESVRRRSLAIDLRNSERGRSIHRRAECIADTIVFEHSGDSAPESVGGHSAEK